MSINKQTGNLWNIKDRDLMSVSKPNSAVLCLHCVKYEYNRSKKAI